MARLSTLNYKKKRDVKMNEQEKERFLCLERQLVAARTRISKEKAEVKELQDKLKNLSVTPTDNDSKPKSKIDKLFIQHKATGDADIDKEYSIVYGIIAIISVSPLETKQRIDSYKSYFKPEGTEFDIAEHSAMIIDAVLELKEALHNLNVDIDDFDNIMPEETPSIKVILAQEVKR